MSLSQRIGLFILILISALYIYFSFTGKELSLPKINNKPANNNVYNPLDKPINIPDNKENKKYNKNMKIFILDKSGNLRPVNRVCEKSVQTSCFEYAINELLSAPSKWEKSKGFTSEIPQSTKLLSIRESSNSIMIDLSSEFESGGGAESTYMRIKQIIKTVNSYSSTPTYLYINGKQANVVGGEGVMLKQPLNERSLDE